MSQLPLVITPGEPAGIGPDILIASAQRAWNVPLVSIADSVLLEQRAAQLGLPLELKSTELGQPLQATAAGQLWVKSVSLGADCQAGKLDQTNSTYVLETLTLATDACLSGQAAGLVTGPVNKAVLNTADQVFSGHTEFLADRSGIDQVVMMLAAPGLRVALVTTHLRLSQVPSAITSDKLERVTRILHKSLRQNFGIEQPRILVCGLNPHAGESGHLGREEIEIINPCLDKLRSEGMNLEGPLPADTLFTPHHLDRADAVLAMYHDQGLPVLKHMGFGEAVNITLGLPFVRTSVDHGTALDLAGTGQADCGSLIAAIEQAQQLSYRPA